jgi:hypothetical protein
MPRAARHVTQSRLRFRAIIILGAGAFAACRGGAATTDTRTATGDCLGRVCLGMSETTALAALGGGAGAPGGGASGAADAGGAGGSGPADTRHCYRVHDGPFYSFWVDEEDPGRRVTGVLATGAAHCADPRNLDDAGAIVTCRGVRLGDPDSFVAKMDRQAVESEKPAYPWPEAPEGTRQLDDDCGGGPQAASMTTLYLASGKVAGLAIWEAD